MNSYLLIDLKAIRHNVEQLRTEIGPDTKLIPVLKGDGYGLEAVKLAHFLDGVGGIDTFAVSQPAEGVELRRAGIGQRILVMSLPLDFQLEEMAEYDLIPTLGSFAQFPALLALAGKTGKQIPVSLKLDTGLHRIGFLPEEADELCGALNRAKEQIRVVDTFSHFMCDTEEQIELQSGRFSGYIERLRGAGIDPGLCHIASSSSLEANRGVCYDAVRVGRRLFLDHPAQPTGRIQEAFSFRAYLTDVRTRKAGETLGYNSRVILERDTRVGVLSVGYGDGLEPNLAEVRAPVLVNGRRAKLLACCMDQSFVDLGEIPCQAGDETTLFGHDGKGSFLSSQEVAGMIGWEGCDLTVRLTNRVQRIYSEE